MTVISLSAVLLILLCFRCGTGLEGESCGSDGVGSVLMKCRSDEMVLIESALLGRFNDSRCYQLTPEEVECFDDIGQRLQNRFPINHSISFKISDTFVHEMNPSCLKKLASLKYAYQCYTVIANETCNGEEFIAKCEEREKRIEIEVALFGRMKSSRCIDFEEHHLSCSVDVQTVMKRRCNGHSECKIKTSFDIFNDSSCDRSLNQYLEVSYKCVRMDANSSTEPSPPPTPTPPYSSVLSMTLVFVGPTVILLLSIVAVCCLIHKIRKGSKGSSAYSDYPESNLRRQQVVNRCQRQNADEYTEYSEYEDYSEVRY